MSRSLTLGPAANCVLAVEPSGRCLAQTHEVWSDDRLPIGRYGRTGGHLRPRLVA